MKADKSQHANATARLQALFDWVTEDIRYVSVAFGKSSHQPHPVADTLNYRYGDCKDQSLLLMTLCREAGIPAWLVLVDANGEDCSEERLGIERFNHCIVQALADQRIYNLDPAAGKAKLGCIPPTYTGAKALKLDVGSGQMVTLTGDQPTSIEFVQETVVKLNSIYSGTVTETRRYTGQMAAAMKEQYKETPRDKTRKYYEELYKRNGQRLIDFFMTRTNDPGDSFETRLSYTIPRFGARTSSGLTFALGGRKTRETGCAIFEPWRMPRDNQLPAEISIADYTI